MKTKELIELLQSLEQDSDVIIMVDDNFYTFVGVYELKGKQYEPRQFMVLAGSHARVNDDKFSHTQRSNIQ